MTKFCTFWSRVPPTGPQHCRVTDILLNSILFSQTESDNTQSTPSGFDNIHQNNKKNWYELMMVMISIIKMAEKLLLSVSQHSLGPDNRSDDHDIKSPE